MEVIKKIRYRRVKKKLYAYCIIDKEVKKDEGKLKPATSVKVVINK